MATFEQGYTLGDEIGKGSYAKVYRCIHRVTKKVWAVKITDKSKTGPKDINDIHHEITMMRRVGFHNHVVQLVEYFETPENIYLILDFIEGGMLFDRIVLLKHYSELHASHLIKNLLMALDHIHSRGIMHRDLKPENLLLRRKCASNSDDTSHLTDVTLTDFGLATRIPGQSCCGSPSYIAPEVIRVGYLRTQREPYDGKCDIWSLGIITFILLSGKMPFQDRNFKKVFQRIIKNQWAFSGEIWDSVSYEAKSFIKEMLTLDPKKRPTAAEALRHPWFASIQPDIHLQESINGIRLFNAQQKLRGAMFMFHATTTLIGGLDQTPPFMKYLTHSNKMSTVIESKSQTDPHKIHYIDFSRIFHQYTLRDLCTCGSKMICRHVQNVHEYLFVGRSDMDVQPFINELLSIKEELRLSLEEDPSNKESNIKYVELGNVIHAANVFHDVFLKAPASEMKPNHMLHLSPPQRLSQENNRARSILKAYQQVGE